MAKSDDPTVTPTATPTGLTFEQMLELQREQTRTLAEAIGESTERATRATHKILKPENPRHPDISAYNPMGERDHPRPELSRNGQDVRYFQGNKELEREGLSLDEITLLNQIQPGEYRCHKRDGSRFTLTVKATVDEAGKLRRIELLTPSNTKELRMNMPSIVDMLREAMGLLPPSVTTLQAEIDRLKAQLAGAA